MAEPSHPDGPVQFDSATEVGGSLKLDATKLKNSAIRPHVANDKSTLIEDRQTRGAFEPIYAHPLPPGATYETLLDAMNRHADQLQRLANPWDARHKCSVCDSAFRYSKDLRRHQATHNSEVRHACNDCDRVYKRKDHLERHTLKTGHTASSTSNSTNTSSERPVGGSVHGAPSESTALNDYASKCQYLDADIADHMDSIHGNAFLDDAFFDDSTCDELKDISWMDLALGTDSYDLCEVATKNDVGTIQTTPNRSDVFDIKTPTMSHGVKAPDASDTNGNLSDDDLNPEPQNMNKESSEAPDAAERMGTVATGMPSVAHTATSIFAETRVDLKSLRRDIEELEESSNSESEFETSNLARTCHGESAGQCEDQQEHRLNTGPLPATGSSPAQTQANKRPQLDASSEDNAQTAIGLSRKKAKTSCERFVCCFRNDPAERCPGTDATISSVLYNLAAKHKIHVCGKCWVLMVKEEQSDRFVHPIANQPCQEHCLSPRCGNAGQSLAIGQRHLFNPETCLGGQRKTSRVSGDIDREAAYRFIFRLVHPTKDQMESILTSDKSHHNHTTPRTGSRRPTREELQIRADDLKIRLEEGEADNIAKAAQIAQLEQELATERTSLAKERDTVSELQKLQSRIVLVLGDALRTGSFSDQAGYCSLRKRVIDYAPDALSFESQLLPTPKTSNSSQRSSTTPMQDNVSVSEGAKSTHAADSQAAGQDATLHSFYSSGSNYNATQQFMLNSDPGLGQVTTNNTLVASGFSPTSIARPSTQSCEHPMPDAGTTDGRHDKRTYFHAPALENSSPIGAEDRNTTLEIHAALHGSKAPDKDLQHEGPINFSFDGLNWEEISCGQDNLILGST